MKHRRVITVILTVAVAGAWLVSTAVAGTPTLGSGRVTKTTCQKLTLQVRQAAADVRGRVNDANQTYVQFRGLHNLLVEDINKAFKPEVASYIRTCRSSYNTWETRVKKYEALLAKWKAKGCGGR